MTYLRKIIKITAEDSPNVRYARAQQAQGIEPTGEMILEGVLSWSEYQKRRQLWDDVRQLIGLDAEFPEDAGTLCYPPDWLNRAEVLHGIVQRMGITRVAKSIGVDPAEGGDHSCWSVVDAIGLIELESMKTPDTSMIPKRTLAKMLMTKVPAERVMFDRGGGGYEHVCQMRDKGHDVQSVGFGETVMDPERYKRFHNNIKTNMIRREEIEERYVYANRRAEMYGLLRDLLNPSLVKEEYRDLSGVDRSPSDRQSIESAIRRGEHVGFAIPPEYGELRRQMSLIPLLYDEEGKMYLPSKNRRKDASDESKKPTLNQMLGCSPDELDSLVLAVFGMVTKPLTRTLKAI